MNGRPPATAVSGEYASGRRASPSISARPAREVPIEIAAPGTVPARRARDRIGSARCSGSRRPMRRFAEGEEVDYVIVGVGAGGGVLLQRLARAGFRVVGFEAGPFWDTERDWVSDEEGSHNLYWNDLRITGGQQPLAFGANNSGKGVGGEHRPLGAFTPRFHPSDFRVHSEDGVGADWPISYWDLKPYYELLELECPSPARRTFPGAILTVMLTGRTRWAVLATS